MDLKFKYEPQVACHFAFKDAEFFVKLCKLNDSLMNRDESIVAVFKHYREILTNEKFKAFRVQFLNLLKSVNSMGFSHGGGGDEALSQYIFKPINTALF